jgi:hypothetical protein
MYTYVNIYICNIFICFHGPGNKEEDPAIFHSEVFWLKIAWRAPSAGTSVGVRSVVRAALRAEW